MSLTPSAVLLPSPVSRTADACVQKPVSLRPGDEKPYYTDVERYLLRPDAFRELTITQFYGATLSRGVDAKHKPPDAAVAHLDKCLANRRFVWEKIRGKASLCRLAPVPKINSETFWLRMLLMQPDMTPASIEDILTVTSHGDPVKHSSFSAAADARGLMKNARAAELVLAECIVDNLATPEVVRSCLTILIRNFDCSGNVLRLVKTFWEHLADPEWAETKLAVAHESPAALASCYGRILQVLFLVTHLHRTLFAHLF
jgi:hypothetical protein